MELWGALGHGRGGLNLDLPAGPGAKADLNWTMAAVGARGEVLEPARIGGLSLAVVTDALWARTASSEANSGSLAAAQADVTRPRVGVEGGWPLLLRGMAIEPTLELGLRHDGGDAENGIGLDIGGGLAWSLPSLGLTLDVSGRTPVAHQDGGFKESGFSAGVLFGSGSSGGSGPSLNLRREFGSAAQGGVESLFRAEPMGGQAFGGGMDGDMNGGMGGGMDTGRWTMEAGWGFCRLRRTPAGQPGGPRRLRRNQPRLRPRLALRTAVQPRGRRASPAVPQFRHPGHSPRKPGDGPRARRGNSVTGPLLNRALRRARAGRPRSEALRSTQAISRAEGKFPGSRASCPRLESRKPFEGGTPREPLVRIGVSLARNSCSIGGPPDRGHLALDREPHD